MLHSETQPEALRDSGSTPAALRLADALDVPMEHAAQMNIDKLALRYPEKYTDTLAAARLDKAET